MQLAVGTKVCACPNGPWSEMAVRSSNDDGTFNLLPVESESDFDEWFGVTPGEISIDDAALWPALYGKFCSTPAGLSRADLAAALSTIGISIPAPQLDEMWTSEHQLAAVLDEGDAYELLQDWGMSAVMFTRPANPRFILYWNDTRMGGRDPAELDAISLADTLAILGLTAVPDDSTELAAFESTHGISLPGTLRALWSKQCVRSAIRDSHGNNPEPQPPSAWRIERGFSVPGLDGSIAVRIMLPHQGSHAWWAVFHEGAADAQVAISFRENGPPVRLVAESLPFFFHDLASTGRCWAARSR